MSPSQWLHCARTLYAALQTAFYFGYSACVAFAFFLMEGFVGCVAVACSGSGCGMVEELWCAARLYPSRCHDLVCIISRLARCRFYSSFAFVRYIYGSIKTD